MIDAFTIKNESDETNKKRISFIDTSHFTNSTDCNLKNIDINPINKIANVIFQDKI